jgi:hypothetical protein
LWPARTATFTYNRQIGAYFSDLTIPEKLGCLNKKKKKNL